MNLFSRWMLTALLALAAIQAHAASQVALDRVEGHAVVVIVDDFTHKTSHLRYFIDRPGKPQIEFLPNAAQAKRLKTGQKIRVTGRGHNQVIEDATVEVLAAEPATAQATQIRKALVILVDITDGNGTKHAVGSNCSTIASDRMFGTSGGRNVDGCYADASFNNLGFGGTTYPGSPSDVVRVSITEASTTWASACNWVAWENAADAAVGSARLSNYQHRVYVLPIAPACGFVGIAYVSCTTYAYCRAAVLETSNYTCGYPDTYTHELGHNLGLGHAGTDAGNDGTIDCTYCDASDFMGYSIGTHRSTNAPHKAMLGWLSGARTVDGTNGGTFTLSALELTNPTYPQTVRITPVAGGVYYLSYRAAIGYDSTLPSIAANVIGKTLVDRTYDGGATAALAQLADGQSFTDAANGLTFTSISHTADTVTLRVSNSNTPAPPPVISVGNVSITEGTSGTKNATFTVQLSGASSLAVTFDVGTEPGTAQPSVDYTTTNLAGVSIPAGQTSTTFNVPIVGDTEVELHETFAVELRNVSNATLSENAGRALGTILNDDIPTLTIADATVAEPATVGGASTLYFTITLSQPLPTATTLNLATQAGTAQPGSDYQAVSASGVMIDAGRTRLVYPVRVYGDAVAEGTETLSLVVSGVSGAAVVDGTAVGTITNTTATGAAMVYAAGLPSFQQIWLDEEDKAQAEKERKAKEAKRPRRSKAGG